MRRVFCHIDEFGHAGFANLDVLLCLSDQLVVWSPAPLLHARAYEEKTTLLGPEDILDLIGEKRERPLLSIIGRQEWFNKTKRNAHPWDQAKWVDGFDDRIRDFAEADLVDKLPVRKRRVIVAPKEQGFDRAESLLAGSQGELIGQRIGQLYRDGRLPQGFMEKARRAKMEEGSVPRFVLRDLFNHEHARVEAAAEVSAIPSQHMSALEAVVPSEFLPTKGDESTEDGMASKEDMHEAVDLLRSISAFRDAEELKKFLRGSDRARLMDLLYGPRGGLCLEGKVAAEVRAAVDQTGVFSQVFPTEEPIETTHRVGSFLFFIASVKFGTATSMAWLRWAVRVLPAVARKVGFLPAKVKDPSGRVKALFQLGIGTKKPTENQIDAMLKKIDRSLR